MLHRRLPLVLLVILTACNEAHAPSEPDAGITFEPPAPARDAGFDAGFDGGPGTPVGAGCAADSECLDGFCLGEEEGFAGGYCTAACTTDADCPGASACVFVGGGMSLCFDACDPAATERECRAYYGCAADLGISMPVCVPGCTDDTDCPADRTCNPAGGGSCYNPAASFGDPCAFSSDCPDGQRCQSEYRRGWPGGMCVAFGCDVVANTGCPDDGQCIPGGRSGFGRCIDGCAEATDCRDGYTCAAGHTDHPDRLVCTPACTDTAQCTEGRTCDTTTGLCG